MFIDAGDPDMDLVVKKGDLRSLADALRSALASAQPCSERSVDFHEFADNCEAHALVRHDGRHLSLNLGYADDPVDRIQVLMDNEDARRLADALQAASESERAC